MKIDWNIIFKTFFTDFVNSVWRLSQPINFFPALPFLYSITPFFFVKDGQRETTSSNKIQI